MNNHERNIVALANIIKNEAPNKKFEYPEESVHVHVNKKLYITRIVKTFTDIMQRYVEEPDYLMIMRWFYTQKLLDFTGKDPLLPYNTDDNESLCYELEKLRVPASEISQLSSTLHNMIKRFDRDFVAKPVGIQMYTKNGSYMFVRENLKFFLKNETYAKLSSLYIGEPELLNERIFKLWCRYESLAAPGYQAAIPMDMFNLLKRELKVNHELFASPFNCNAELTYTSAYPDTDSFFGSKGNFFREYPKLFAHGGSFEANPPFLEEHMTVLTLIIEEALKSAVPLSFVVVYPAWEDAISHATLKNSKYNVLTHKVLNFESLKHHYVQSSQYWNKDEITRASRSRSSIFILQNEGGKREYPVSTAFVNKLILSFA
jgi:phosphorylated CTD-interacting factor 1